MSAEPLPPLECQVVAAGAATRPGAWRRQMENQAVYDNVRFWRDGHRDSDQGIPLPPADQRAWSMALALTRCVERTNARAT